MIEFGSEKFEEIEIYSKIQRTEKNKGWYLSVKTKYANENYIIQ